MQTDMLSNMRKLCHWVERRSTFTELLIKKQNTMLYAYALGEPVDQLELMKTVQEVLEDLDNPDNSYLYIDEEKVTSEIKVANVLFRQLGWEGDGVFRMMWMPPFLLGGTGDNFGDFVYFVKQRNNGTCFVCSHEPLPILPEALFGKPICI